MIDWGSVADWVAAVGTSGALVATLGIVVGDRTRERRRQVDQLMTSGYRSRVIGDSNGFIISARNLSPYPLQWVRITTRPDQFQIRDTFHYFRPTKSIRPGEVVFEPGDLANLHIMDEIGYFYPRFILEIKDASGFVWRRDAESGRYVSRLRYFWWELKPSLHLAKPDNLT